MTPLARALYGITKVIVGASYTGRTDYDQQLAAQGFEGLDIEVEFCRKHVELPALSRSVMLVDGVSQVRGALYRHGRRVRHIGDYPTELERFFGRRIETMTWGELNKQERRAFIKRPGKGNFQPMVANFPFLKSKQSADVDPYNVMHIDDNDTLLVSEPVTFLAEWRAFVLDGEVLDVRQYRGDWRLRPDEEVIDAANGAFCPDWIRGYAIDFGLTDDGRTLLVEVNAGYSLGAYGLRPDLYARLLAAAWEGVWGSDA